MIIQTGRTKDTSTGVSPRRRSAAAIGPPSDARARLGAAPEHGHPTVTAAPVYVDVRRTRGDGVRLPGSSNPHGPVVRVVVRNDVNRCAAARST
jgi:hypothetical protein